MARIQNSLWTAMKQTLPTYPLHSSPQEAVKRELWKSQTISWFWDGEAKAVSFPATEWMEILIYEDIKYSTADKQWNPWAEFRTKHPDRNPNNLPILSIWGTEVGFSPWHCWLLLVQPTDLSILKCLTDWSVNWLPVSLYMLIWTLQMFVLYTIGWALLPSPYPKISCFISFELTDC